MQRRRALVVAGTLTATLAMAGTAMAVNLGLLGADSDPVGDLNPTELQPAAERQAGADAGKPRVRVIVQDIPVGGGTASGTGGATSTGSPAPAPAPAEDSSYDDDVYEDDSHDDDAYEDEADEIDDHDDHDEVDEPDEVEDHEDDDD